MLPVIKSPDGNVTVLVNNCQPYVFNDKHINYQLLMKAIEDNDSVVFLKLYDVQKTLQTSLDTYIVDKEVDFHISNGQIFFNGEVVHNFVCERILEAYRTNVSYKNLVCFLKKLLQNPSRNAVEQLYSFLERKGMPITDDGDFIAWKSVRTDYLDKYSGTIDNSVGKVIEVTRNKVDDNYQHECSHGLHVGALEYSGPGGWYNSPQDKVLAVKVNPKDAVAVPQDHNFTKLRVCRYEVVGEHKANPTSNFTNKSSANEFIDNMQSDNWEDEDEEDNDECEDDECVCSLVGYYPGESVQFLYRKPEGAKTRRVCIEECSETHVYGADLDDGETMKSFRIDRIDLSTVRNI